MSEWELKPILVSGKGRKSIFKVCVVKADRIIAEPPTTGEQGKEDMKLIISLHSDNARLKADNTGLLDKLVRLEEFIADTKSDMNLCQIENARLKAEVEESKREIFRKKEIVSYWIKRAEQHQRDMGLNCHGIGHNDGSQLCKECQVDRVIIESQKRESAESKNAELAKRVEELTVRADALQVAANKSFNLECDNAALTARLALVEGRAEKEYSRGYADARDERGYHPPAAPVQAGPKGETI